jgi:hypothetical protein
VLGVGVVGCIVLLISYQFAISFTDE